MTQGDNAQIIQEAFTHLSDVDDMISLINLAKSDLYGNFCKPITIKQFNFHRYNFNANRYTAFTIKKKNGGIRTICAPNDGLKAIQNCLNYIFQLCYSPNNSAYGFIAGRSVVDNAQQHIGQNYIYNVDLKDFFSSIEVGRIFKRLQVKPFNLPKEVASAIADICCQKMIVERIDQYGVWVKKERSVLPQGAPTSPVLTNIICEKLDRELLKLATHFNLKYSRYADDITFSGYYNAFDGTSTFIRKMKGIITKEGFYINEKKTRLQKNNSRQEVTGLIVSKDRVNVSKRYVKELRGILYCWEKYGKDDVVNRFLPRYNAEKGYVKKNDPQIENVISGKLCYLRMVKGKNNSTYKKLQERFYKLCGINPQQFLDEILNVWEQKGIDAAMGGYYKKNAYDDVKFTSIDYKTFILDILSASMANPQYIDKIINLLLGKEELRQFSKEEIVKACIKRLKETSIEKKISDKIPYNYENSKKHPKIHNPKFTAEFLSLFNRRDGFKYLTHNYDNSGLTLEDVVNRAKIEFNRYNNSKDLPESLRALMNRFINGGGEWMDSEGKKCAEGYSTSNWHTWSVRNGNLHPIMDIGGYENIIQRFRHTIRVVAPDLQNIVESIEKNYPMFKFELINLNKADFYTNVYILRRGLSELIKDMADHKENNNIRIEYKPGFDGDFFIRQIIITQMNSMSHKSITEVIDKFNSGGGSFYENADKITGYCNWSVESLWDGKPYRWNILKEDNVQDYEEIDKHNVLGFSHILTFYYKD